MFCGKCGKEIPDTSNFCPLCGAKLSEEIPKSQQEKTLDMQGQPQFTHSSNKDNTLAKDKKKNKGIFIVVVATLATIGLAIAIFGSNRGANLGDNFDGIFGGSNKPKSEKEQLETLDMANQYMDLGEYDKALELYESIDLETARIKAKAIKCIPVANSIINEYISADEERERTKITANFISFNYEYYYDVDNYEFHMVTYYSDMTDSFISQYGLWSSYGPKDANDKTKEAFATFLNAGFEDIVCVEDIYNHSGAYRATIYYDIDAYRKYPPESSTSANDSNLDPRESPATSQTIGYDPSTDPYMNLDHYIGHYEDISGGTSPLPYCDLYKSDDGQYKATIYDGSVLLSATLNGIVYDRHDVNFTGPVIQDGGTGGIVEVQLFFNMENLMINEIYEVGTPTELWMTLNNSAPDNEMARPTENHDVVDVFVGDWIETERGTITANIVKESSSSVFVQIRLGYENLGGYLEFSGYNGEFATIQGKCTCDGDDISPIVTCSAGPNGLYVTFDSGDIDPISFTWAQAFGIFVLSIINNH